MAVIRTGLFLTFYSIVFLNHLSKASNTRAATAAKCGYILTDPWNGSPIIGGRSSACKEYYVSYASCKMLLSQSLSCNALIYKDKVCTLLDRSTSDFRNLGSRRGESKPQMVTAIKLIPELDSCIGKAESHQGSPVHRYEKCLYSKTSSYLQKNKRKALNGTFASLPLLNIVISVTQSWINSNKQGMDLIVAHWTCYAKLHGYIFTLNKLHYNAGSECYVEKHESIVEKHLPRAQWVFHLDADSIVLNMSRTLDDFISRHQRSSNPYGSDHAIILQRRENTEVASGVYFLRNDPRSYCFMEYWRSFHPPWIPPTPQKPFRSIIPVPNFDNGALIGALLMLITGRSGVDCLESLDYNLTTTPFPYPEQACLNKYRTKVYELSRPNVTHELSKFGLKILWLREGLWRSHEKAVAGHVKTGQWRLYNRCYPSSDLIGHGNKDIAREMLEPHHSTQCDMNMKSDPVRSINGKCTWYNMTEEMEVLRYYCMWRSPACVTSMGGEGVKNRCVEPSKEESAKGLLINDRCFEYKDFLAVDSRIKTNKLEVNFTDVARVCSDVATSTRILGREYPYPEDDHAIADNIMCHTNLVDIYWLKIPIAVRCHIRTNVNAGGQNPNVLTAMKLIPSLDRCRSQVAVHLVSPTHSLEKCLYTSLMKRNKRNLTEETRDFASLPLLNIVISVTQSWINNNKHEMDLIVAHWTCYAKLHGYIFTLNKLHYNAGSECYVEKHESIVEKHLPRAQWVFHLDADSIVLNMSRTLDDFISRHQRSSNPYGSDHAIILQRRENTEVASGVYFLRNDPRSYCFMEYWRSFHPPWIPPTPQKPFRSIIPVPNFDNGALIGALLMLITGRSGVDCLESLDYNLTTTPFPYPEQACLNKYRTKVYELSRPNVTHELSKFGLKILWLREGLWRSHEKAVAGHVKTGQWRLYNRCYPSSDLIGHGNKDIAREMLEPHHSTQCDMNMKSDPVRSINGKCTWYNMTEEMEVLRYYCMWRSPACVTSMGGEGVKNRCVEPSKEESAKGLLINDRCFEYKDFLAVDSRIKV
eukprot:gene7971-16317_t